MERKLIAIVHGGLCNRLKTIVSAHRIAEETGRTLQVFWSPKFAWNPDGTDTRLPWPGGWKDLFASTIAEIDWDDVKGLDWLGASASEQRWGYHVIPRHDERSVMVRAGWRWMRYEDEADVDLLSSEGVRDTHWPVIRAILPYMSVAQPVPRLRAAADDFAEAHGIDHTWRGLHVRTEHNYCRRVSLESYCAAVDRELAARPSARFLLAADAAAPERELLERYRGRMVAYPKASHEVVHGLQTGDAVIDLLLLARAGGIIGAQGSTYNEFAWWMAGCAVPLTLVRPASQATV